MNPTTFNDPFAFAMSKWPIGNEPIPFTKLRWRNAPLFDYQTTREKEKGLVKSMLGADPPFEERQWPYEFFRLALTETSMQPWEENGTLCGKGQYRCNILAMRDRGRAYILGHIRRMFDETPESVETHRVLDPFILYVHDMHSLQGDVYECKNVVFARNEWYAHTEFVNVKEMWQG